MSHNSYPDAFAKLRCARMKSLSYHGYPLCISLLCTLGSPRSALACSLACLLLKPGSVAAALPLF